MTLAVSTVSTFLAAAIDASGRTQQQIADVCGFKRPNMVSMMIHGKVKVPYKQIKPLARALRIDHRELARVVIGETEPELLTLLDDLQVNH